MHIEKHPFPEFIPEGAKTLIVGSFPPIKLTVREDLKNVSGKNKHLYKNYFCSNRNKRTDADKNFYYGSRENLLWDLIGEALGAEVKLDTVENIKSFLKANLIGVTDIIEQCQRNSTTRKPSKTNPHSDCIGSLDRDLIILKYRDVIETIINNKFETVFCTSQYVYDELMTLGKNSVLSKIEVKILLSPSPAASIPISKKKDYIDKKSEDQNYNTKMYRVEKYKEAFMS